MSSIYLDGTGLSPISFKTHAAVVTRTATSGSVRQPNTSGIYASASSRSSTCSNRRPVTSSRTQINSRLEVGSATRPGTGGDQSRLAGIRRYEAKISHTYAWQNKHNDLPETHTSCTRAHVDTQNSDWTAKEYESRIEAIFGTDDNASSGKRVLSSIYEKNIIRASDNCEKMCLIFERVKYSSVIDFETRNTFYEELLNLKSKLFSLKISTMGKTTSSYSLEELREVYLSVVHLQGLWQSKMRNMFTSIPFHAGDLPEFDNCMDEMRSALQSCQESVPAREKLQTFERHVPVSTEESQKVVPTDLSLESDILRSKTHRPIESSFPDHADEHGKQRLRDQDSHMNSHIHEAMKICKKLYKTYNSIDIYITCMFKEKDNFKQCIRSFERSLDVLKSEAISKIPFTIDVLHTRYKKMTELWDVLRPSESWFLTDSRKISEDLGALGNELAALESYFALLTGGQVPTDDPVSTVTKSFSDDMRIFSNKKTQAVSQTVQPRKVDTETAVKTTGRETLFQNKEFGASDCSDASRLGVSKCAEVLRTTHGKFSQLNSEGENELKTDNLSSREKICDLENKLADQVLREQKINSQLQLAKSQLKECVLENERQKQELEVAKKLVQKTQQENEQLYTSISSKNEELDKVNVLSTAYTTQQNECRKYEKMIPQLRADITKLHTDISKLHTDVSQLRSQNAEQQIKISSQQHKYDERVSQLQAEISGINSQKTELEAEIGRITLANENKASHYEEKLQVLNDQLRDQLKQNLTQVEKERNESIQLQQQVSELQAYKKKQCDKIGTLEIQNRELEKKCNSYYEHIRVRESLPNTASDFKSEDRQIKKLKYELDQANFRINELESAQLPKQTRDRGISTETQFNARESDKSNLELQVKELEEKCKKLQGESDSFQTAAIEYKSEYSTLEKQFSVRNARISQLERDLERERNRSSSSQRSQRHQDERLRELEAKNQDLRNRMSKTLLDGVAGSSNLEDVSHKNRPLSLREKYDSICSTEWLEAKDKVDNYFPSASEKERSVMLCTVFLACYSVAMKKREELLSLLSDPLNSTGASAKQPRQAPTSLKRGNQKFHEMVLDYYLSTSDQTDPDGMVEDVLNELRNTLQKDSVRTISGSVTIKTFIKAVCNLCWSMVIQRVPLKFSVEGVGREIEPTRQRAYYNSDTSGSVRYYINPELWHGEQLLSQGLVFVSRESHA